MKMMKKLFCGFLALVMMAAVVAKAGEPIGFEIRKRNAIGRWGPTGIHATVKAEADGSVGATFQAPEAGTYALVYTSGPNTGKTATTIKVEKAGPVTTKIR
jgi:hypothetical protein